MLETIIARNRLKESIRELFLSWGFTEVETPTLIPYCNPDNNVENVRTEFKDFQGKKHTWFLHTSPEFFMKRLIWLGAERIFQITKVFRSGEITPLHQVEFTMVEWYRVGEDFKKGMEETEEIVKRGAEEFGVKEITFRGNKTSLKEFKRISVKEAFEEFAGVNVLDREQVIKISGEKDYEGAFFKLLVDRVEPKLAQLPHPVFLFGYPEEFSAMAEVENGIAQRFELYIAGVELANGYTELRDYGSYREKFEKKGICALDKRFLELLKRKPLPKCEGVALGFDRLLMLLLGKENLEEVIPFSTSKLLKELPSS